MRNVVPAVGALFIVVVLVVNFTPLRDVLISFPPRADPGGGPARERTSLRPMTVEALAEREAALAIERQYLDGLRVTSAEYTQLTTGMSYRQAVAIIGFPGEELSRVEIAGTTTVMYQWMNPTGANMNAMFQNDRMVQKAQFGLP